MSAVSREWAEAFLKEWARPYFGEDGTDAVACVQRAAEFANACVTTPGVTDSTENTGTVTP